MEIKKISDKIFEGGAIIEAKYKDQELTSLNKKKIINIFEKKGVIIFRGFKIIPNNMYL